VSQKFRFKWALGIALLCSAASARAQTASSTPAPEIQSAPTSQEFEIAVLTRDACAYYEPQADIEPNQQLKANIRVMARAQGSRLFFVGADGRNLRTGILIDAGETGMRYITTSPELGHVVVLKLPKRFEKQRFAGPGPEGIVFREGVAPPSKFSDE
jgi:hypothetical protein